MPQRIIGTAFHADSRCATAPCAGAAQACAPAFPRADTNRAIPACYALSHARPDKAVRADAHAIANGLTGVVDDVKKMTARIDDHRSRPLVCRVGDDLAGEGEFRPSRLFPRRENVGIGRPAYTGYQSEQHGACRTPYDLPAGQTREPDLHRHFKPKTVEGNIPCDH